MKSKNKDEILEEIKVLKEKNLSEFKELKTEVEHISTDEGSDHHSPKKNSPKKEMPVIKESALEADEYGHTPLSTAIEEGNIGQVRDMYSVTKNLNDADLLRTIAIDMMDKTVQQEYELTRDIVSTIYSEAKYQLKVMGEDIDMVIDAYNLD